MADSEHRRKKQYQSDISSYFHKQLGPNLPPPNVSSPPLPAETQASLLNVGMRVRKSVPEGYKTQKPMSNVLPSTPTRPNDRELEPFSGIHRTGGYARQSPSQLSSPPPLTMSQETISTQDSCGNGPGGRKRSDEGLPGRKRCYNDEIEEDMDMIFDEMDEEDARSVQTRCVAQPRTSGRKSKTDRRPGITDFTEAQFLQPDIDMADWD